MALTLENSPNKIRVLGMRFLTCSSDGKWAVGDPENTITSCINRTTSEINLANNITTDISSISSGNLSYLVDGLFDTSGSSVEILSTDSEANQWWKIDLFAIYGIREVILYASNGKASCLHIINY